MRLSWFGIVEDSAEDARGALTLVGVSQNVISVKDLPTGMRRAMVLILDDEGETLPTGTTIPISLKIEGPTGDVISAVSQAFPVGEKRYADLPGTIQIAAQTVFPVTATGRYRMSCEVSPPGQEQLIGEASLYVVQQ